MIDTRKPQNEDIKHYLRDNFDMVIAVTDQDDAAVDLSAKSLVFSIRSTENGAAVETLSTTAGTITISGASNNILTFSKALTLSERVYFYDLDNVTDNDTIADGVFIATYKGR